MRDTDRYQRQIALAAVGSSVILLLLVTSSYLYILSKTASTSHLERLSSEQLKKDEQPEQVTICQLKADPAIYNRKLVKVRAFLSHGFEDSAIFDPDCELRLMVARTPLERCTVVALQMLVHDQNKSA